VTNSAIYLGWGMGVTIQDSANVFLGNNNFFSFVRFGVYVESSLNITLDQNVLVGVSKRELVTLDHFVDISGGYIMCGADITD